MRWIPICVFCLAFSVVEISSSEVKICMQYVDITDGVREGVNIIKDGITYTPSDYVTVDNTIKGCICNVRACVRKCCEQGKMMNLTTRKCISSSDDGFVSGLLGNIVHVPENKICNDKQVKININQDFTVEEGVLIWDDFKFTMDNFCMAVTPENTTYAIACVSNEEIIVDSIVTSLGKHKSIYLFVLGRRLMKYRNKV